MMDLQSRDAVLRQLFFIAEAVEKLELQFHGILAKTLHGMPEEQQAEVVRKCETLHLEVAGRRWALPKTAVARDGNLPG